MKGVVERALWGVGEVDGGNLQDGLRQYVLGVGLGEQGGAEGVPL